MVGSRPCKRDASPLSASTAPSTCTTPRTSKASRPSQPVKPRAPPPAPPDSPRSPPVALGAELAELAWVTPGFVKVLMTDGASPEDVIKTLVQAVHLNPAAPQLMNVYTSAADCRESARCTRVFDGQAWVGGRNNNDVASNIACALGKLVVERMGAHRDDEPGDDDDEGWAGEFREFVHAMHRDYSFAREVVELVAERSAWVAHFHPGVLQQFFAAAKN